MVLRNIMKGSRLNRSKPSFGGVGTVDAAKKKEMIEKYLEAHRGNTKLSLREQLRAKSMFQKKIAAASRKNDGGEDVEPMPVDAREMIDRLEADVDRLTEKCSALESQNILVAVQQLDMFAQLVSYALSFTMLYWYWRIILWGKDKISFSEIFPLKKMQDSYMGGDDVTARVAISIVEVIHHPWMFSLIQVILIVFPYIHNRSTHGSMHRRFQVFVVAFIVVGRIRLCRWREKMFVQSESTKSTSENSSLSKIPRYGEGCNDNGIWEANYEISARFLYLSILRLRGLWTKTAQYMSSRADFVPAAYIRELSKFQDQTEATPWNEVERMLPARLLKELTDIEKTPLASASIGQVHTARLKSTNQKVVIKVQHPHARTLLTDDFRSLKIICRIIAWMEPDYSFMEILMSEWATEARKELNFCHEAEHLREAHSELKKLIPTSRHLIYTSSDDLKVPFQIEVPLPIEELSNQTVLVMNFCEGCRVNDFEQIGRWGLSRTAIMDGISQAFAHFMYCSAIFNADPHPGNILVRPGTTCADDDKQNSGFTLVLLDWGLAKRLPEQKRLAFCQMVYAAATFDYGLLLDSYNTVGLRMKREDAGQGMEDMRFFLRDMAPRDESLKRIKSKIKADKAKREETNEKVPMESKAYPGEFFFFIRVNELLHGLGGRYSVNLGYLDALKPYAELGLRSSSMYDLPVSPPNQIQVEDATLQEKLKGVLQDLEAEDNLAGAQVCVLDKDGKALADAVAGSLGGLRSHIPMTRSSVILGYSTTKAVTATLAHIMVHDGYLTYDEPICDRVWARFCPTKEPPTNLHHDLNQSIEEIKQRWHWKCQITLRHILNHTAGLYTALPTRLTVKRLAKCEDCSSAYEYNEEAPDETLLPSTKPGERSEYHYLSFGWLVAGTLCGAYALQHNKCDVTFDDIYRRLLEPKLSKETVESGFYPLGGYGDNPFAQTVTSDIRASKMMQMRREASVMGSDRSEPKHAMMEALEGFKGKEFLLDPRIWNCEAMLKANVPAAGGRFSAFALANFYRDLSQGKLLNKGVLDDLLSNSNSLELSSGSELQGVVRNESSSTSNYAKVNFGYQRIRTDRDDENTFSCVGHSGVGGSIALWHVQTGLCISVMLNKSDGNLEVTKRILGIVADHYKI